MDRRAFLKSSLLGAATLATGSSLYGCADLDILTLEIIDDDASIALAALLPIFLNGALPIEAELRRQKIERTLTSIKLALNRFPPHTLDQLNDLFALLTSRLAIVLTAGRFAAINSMTVEQKIQLLESWRNSYFNLLNTAYEGLKELIFAAFYGDPENWFLLDYQKPQLGI